jgi:predicted metal-dependent hydrolase
MDCKAIHDSFTCHMLFDFILRPRRADPAEELLEVRGHQISLTMVRNLRARRYLLRLRPDGSARVTLPRHGSAAEGRRFAERNTAWLAGQLEKLAAQPIKSKEWLPGTEILLRGESSKIVVGLEGMAGTIQIDEEVIRVSPANGDLRAPIEKHFWKLATKEFPPRVFELAVVHQLVVKRVTVRNQRSRWGSCSRRGTISLNWRLIQTPPFVRDYIILHELMHLRQMNHSPRFWQEVEKVCPDYETAERWLKQHSRLLH